MTATAASSEGLPVVERYVLYFAECGEVRCEGGGVDMRRQTAYKERSGGVAVGQVLAYVMAVALGIGL